MIGVCVVHNRLQYGFLDLLVPFCVIWLSNIRLLTDFQSFRLAAELFYSQSCNSGQEPYSRQDYHRLWYYFLHALPNEGVLHNITFTTATCQDSGVREHGMY